MGFCAAILPGTGAAGQNLKQPGGAGENGRFSRRCQRAFPSPRAVFALRILLAIVTLLNYRRCQYRSCLQVLLGQWAYLMLVLRLSRRVTWPARLPLRLMREPAARSNTKRGSTQLLSGISCVT